MSSIYLIYLTFVILLTVIYFLLMLFYLMGWLSAPEFFPKEKKTNTKVSIIIPARNEESNIDNCIGDILLQTYPSSLFEVIVIDDFSEDKTVEVVESFHRANVRLFRLKDFLEAEHLLIGYKKKAIEIGVQHASGDLIVTTDADCRMEKDWLHTLVSFYEEKKCKMIVAPVLFSGDKNVFEKFQSLDYLGMTAITAGTLQFNFPTMCNGANLAYEKEVFEKVNGFKNSDVIASGDDMLLMHKVWKQWPGEVLFLKSKSAAVFTQPNHDFKSFFRQRIRWTSKSKYYTDWKIKVNLLLVYIFNLSLLLTAALSFFSFNYFFLLLFQVALKVIADFSLLAEASKFFNRQKLLIIFVPSEVMHLFYVVIIGFLGNIIPPNWKGRKVR